MAPRLTGQRGLSLIEALVALAVMAFGMLGVVGLQATLRQSADIAKQRSEAVRLAQEEIERWRAFVTLGSAAAPAVGYGDLASSVAPISPVAGSNANYTVERGVIEESLSPRYKNLTVNVTWVDRTGAPQGVRLTSSIHRVVPELAGTISLSANGTPTWQPGSRNRNIPPGAVPQADGTTSVFTPPGAASGVSWVFNNVTGVITEMCTAVATCLPTNALLLSGFVRFADGIPVPASSTPTAPTAAVAENPVGTVPNGGLQVEVALTLPTAATIGCFQDGSAASLFVRYYCAVPVSTSPGPPTPFMWSGRSRLLIANLSTTWSDRTPTNHKVCRYTTVASDMAPNVDHPLDYTNVTTPLSNQNFLVISAGDGTTEFDCPDDNAATPLNSRTRRHQPL